MKTYVFTNRVYPPVGGATGELLKELAEGLAGVDTRVVVVTGGEGEACGIRHTADGRRREGAEVGGRQSSEFRYQKRETVNEVEVIRVGTVPFTRASHWRRALSYLGLYPQLMWQVWKLGRIDAVVSMTDPPLQVAAVTLASCRAKKKIHWAQDVYPELAEELGVIGRGGLLAGILRAVSTWALRRQDEIVVVGRCMRERLVQRGIDAGKIEVIPNWSSVTPVAPEQVQAVRERLGWHGRFIALYSGNIGLAHDFETLVGAAKLLEGAGVQIVFAGDGPRLEEVKRETAGMTHVTFLTPQAKETLSAFLAAADVHLVTVRAGLEGLVVPSKAYGILAAGRPVTYVGSAESEIGKLLSESGAGLVLGNGDARGLANALTEIWADPTHGRMMGECALKFAGQFTVGEAVERWRSVLA